MHVKYFCWHEEKKSRNKIWMWQNNVCIKWECQYWKWFSFVVKCGPSSHDHCVASSDVPKAANSNPTTRRFSESRLFSVSIRMKLSVAKTGNENWTWWENIHYLFHFHFKREEVLEIFLLVNACSAALRSFSFQPVMMKSLIATYSWSTRSSEIRSKYGDWF